MGYSRFVNWQHLHILSATNYLRERIASGAPDARAKEVYEGLLDVLHPSRVEARLKSAAAAPEAPVTPPAAPARRKPAKRAPPAKRKRR